MLTVKSLKTNHHKYYLELVSSNYYVESGEPAGIWAGQAASEFGFEVGSRVEAEHLTRLCEGFDPQSGKPLVQNAGRRQGECRSPRTPGHDCTFSMPKSASILWACADEDLRRAIDEMALRALKGVLQFLEDHCGFARVGKGGLRLEGVPLLFAVFRQSTSRESDPHHHLHTLFINITRKADGSARAVDSTHVYHYKMAAGALYRVALAQGFRELGFEVTLEEKGRHLFFEIKGVPRALCEAMATRRAIIEEEAERRFGSVLASSAEDRERVSVETKRAKKDLVVPGKSLFESWQRVAAEYGFTPESIEAMRRPEGALLPAERPALRESVFHEAIGKLEATQAHFDRADIVMAVAQEAQGKLTTGDVLEVIEEKLSGNTLLHLGGQVTKPRNHAERAYMERIEQRFTTHANWAMEEALRRAVLELASLRHEVDARLVEAALLKRPTMKEEQVEAVRYLCSGAGIRAMTGNAGTGKSFALGAVKEAFEAAGYTVRGCSLASDAAKELQKSSGIPSETLQMTLARLDRGRLLLTERSVLVLDEAGTVGTVMMTRLLQHVARAGAKVLLVGDSKQLQPIEAGGPFKHICSLVGDVLLKRILRQVDPTRHKAIEDFAYGQSREALREFIKRGELHELPTKAQVITRMVMGWVRDGGHREPEKTLLIANLHSDVRILNRKCQAVRIQSGQVRPERKVVANGEVFHEGDFIRFQKLDRKQGLVNGSMGEVLSIDEATETLKVRLREDGRELLISLPEYGKDKVRLGYASTTYSSQGKSVETAHVLIGGPMSDRHSAYVQASRAKYRTELYVPSDQAGPEYRDITRVLAREHAKDLAHDVAIELNEQQPPLRVAV